jgi:co-chaperonin GroES (HSP10)
LSVIKPLFSRVLIERELAAVTGILLLPSTKKRLASLRGTVHAVGPEVTAVKPGDVVLLGRYAGTWIDEDGSVMPDGFEEDNDRAKYFICQDEEILAVIE